MRFPAKKNAGCPKAPRDFPPRKDGILYPPSGCLGTPLPLPQSLCGRTDGRTSYVTTITSQPKFLGSIGYPICLAMELRWRALPAGFSLRSPTLIVRHGASDASIFFIYLIASLKFSLTYLLPRALTRTRRPIRAPSRSPRLRSPALTNSNSNSNPNSSFPFVIYTVV